MKKENITITPKNKKKKRRIYIDSEREDGKGKDMRQ